MNTPIRRTATVVAAAFVTLATALALPSTAHASVPTTTQATAPAVPGPDGLSQGTPAASCWEIKQLHPSSPSGVYWLQTPAMTTPEQFHCDQTTSGGGWVLVGRGREGWSESITGAGTTAQVRSDVSSPAGFSPRQLSGETIDALNNDAPISSLSDGIRLRRATNTAGTSWQELNFKLASPRVAWTWQFANEQRLAEFTIDGRRTTSNSRTSDFGTDTRYNRVRTVTGSNEGWQYGFGFGAQVSGLTDAQSYLWSKTTSSGNARPFTQVYLRPRLLSADVFPQIPDSGTPAVSVAASSVSSDAMPTNWGVNGLGAGPSSTEGSNEVSAFAEVGDTVVVGGNFTRVQKTASGGGQQSQAYLAAFARDSAEWVPGFRPTFNNQVKALATLPGNRVAVGGFFSQVNGQPVPGLVVLNATTGQIDPGFTTRLINYLSGGTVAVRALEVHDGWLYIGGTFTHATNGGAEVYGRNAVRVSVTDGAPDPSWNPEFNGTVVSVDVAAAGDRAYFAGFFSTSRSRPADKAAAVSTTDTSLTPWPVVFSSRAAGRTGYQQAVLEVDGRVWLGGSEHSLVSYDRATLQPLSSNITKAGGDFQALATDGNAVYGGCHCFETTYSGVTTWPDVGTQWTSADAIYAAGAWSTSTGDHLPGFNPNLNTRGGAGAWALFVDSRGQLWEGGDITYSQRAGGVRQWSGGFVRFAQRDVTPPPTPANLQVTANASATTVTWEAPSSTADVSGYQILRNNRVVLTTTALSAELPLAPAGTRYFVRSIDAAGNASASSPLATATVETPPPFDATLVAAGSSWQYLYDATGPAGAASAWTAPTYDTSAWATGTAPLGWGHSSLGTTLPTTAPRPLASFYRRSFSVPDPTRVDSVTITVRADDGVVVYLNGTEIGRANVDPGAAGVGTYANAAVSAGSALATPVRIVVPASSFVAGTNVIAASTHSNYRSTPSHSFELSAVATFTP